MRKRVSQTLALAAAALIAMPVSAVTPQLEVANKTQKTASVKFDGKAKGKPFLYSYEAAHKAGKSAFVTEKKAPKARMANFAPNSAAAAAMPEFYTQVVYSEAEDFPGVGIYSMGNDGSLNLYYASDYMSGAYGAALDEVQHTYRTNDLQTLWGFILGAQSVYYNVNEDGEFDLVNIWEEYDDMSYMAYALTIDQESGKLYGCFQNATGSKLYIGEMPGIDAPQSSMLIPQEEGGSYVLAPWNACGLDIDAKAKTKYLYGMSSNGNLVRVDIKDGSKTYGEQTIVGNTGVTTDYLTAGTVKDGTFYYATCGEDLCSMYAIDLKTAKATKLFDFEGIVEISNLFEMPALAKEKAPAVPTTGVMNFPKAALTGDITFTMPSTLYDGTAASGQCDYTVKVYLGEENDANLVDTRNGEASYKSTLVTETFTLPQAGLYTFVVYAENAAGPSPKLKIRGWVGPDSPAAPQNVQLAYDYSKKQFIVSWDAVTEGEHAANGSYFDAKAVKYNVTLNPATTGANAQNLTVTSYKYNMAAPAQLTKYYYTVEVVYNGVASGVTKDSNVWTLGATDSPVEFSLETKESAAEVFSFDGNGDGVNWKFDDSRIGENDEKICCMSITYNSYEPKDDWLVTPGINLEEGMVYEFSADLSVASDSYPENAEFKVAQNPEPASMNKGTVVLETVTLTNTSFETYSGTFTCPKTGVYFFGVHATSPADMYMLYARNLKVSGAMDANAPKAVANLQAIPDENGGASALVSFNVPTETILGNAIKNVSYVEVYRNGLQIAEITKGLQAGNYVKYIDESAELNAYNTYEIVPVLVVNNEGGTTETLKGATAQVTIYVGVEGVQPGNVTNIEVTEDGNTGKINITWSTPTESTYGDPLPSHVCKYQVLDGNYNVLQDTNYDTEYTTDFGADYQGFVDLYIRAYIVDENGNVTYGPVTSTGLVFVGKPYGYPFIETLENGYAKYQWATTTWGWIDMPAEFGLEVNGVDDNYYISSYSQNPTGNTLESGKILIPADAKAPYLSFYWFMFDETDNNELNVSIRANGGKYEVVENIIENDGEMGWNRVLVDLEEYKGQTIQIKFDAELVAMAVDIIDRITVSDVFDKDLSGSYTETPQNVYANSEFTITAGIFNDGKDGVPAGKYTVSLYRNGEKAQTVNGVMAIPTGSSASFEFKDTLTVVDNDVEYYAVAEWDADEDLANNYTPINDVDVDQTLYPTTELTGVLNELGQADLSWIAAEAKPGSDKFSDGFEDYKPWISVGDQEGDWETIDGDNNDVLGLSYWPTNQLPNDFFVVDVEEGGLGSDYAHSGKNVLVSAADYYGMSGSYDWLISKELKPDGIYDLTFWARGLGEEYGSYTESFAVLVSDSDKNMSDFDMILYVPEVPSVWTEFKMMLPEGTKYFAIVCLSTTKGGLFFVDDINVAPMNLNLVGYNLYRNGVRVNEEPIAEVNYVDTTAKEVQCTYVVSVVWDKGESAPSNDVTLQVTQNSIDSIQNALANVTVDGRNIIISNAEGQKVAIYSADGKTLYNAGGSAKAVVTVEPAVYVVKVGDKTARVIVR